MTTLRRILLIVLFSSTHEFALAGQNRDNRPLLLGAIHQGQAYCSVMIPLVVDPKTGRVEKINSAITPPHARILTRDLASDSNVSRYDLLYAVDPGYPHRWRVAYGHVWGLTISECGSADVPKFYITRLPLTDLDAYSAEKFSPPLKGATDAFGVKFWPFIVPLDTEVREAWDNENFGKDKAPFYDFLPGPKDSCKLFILSTGSIITVYEYTATWKTDDRWEGKEREIQRIKARFREHFCVLEKDSAYFFVTESGEVYVAKKTQAGEWRTADVWSDTKRPVTAIITDADRGKTYLFGRSLEKKDGESKEFFFELDEKPQIQQFARSSIKPVKAEEPLKTVLEYAHVLPIKADEKKP